MPFKKYNKSLTGGIVGIFLGFLIIHPFSMVFQNLIYPTFRTDFGSIVEAFSAPHLPMAFFFSILGFAVGSCVFFLVESLSKEKKRVKVLEGLLPICSYCKKIKDTDNSDKETEVWIEVERYISRYTNTDFTHGICPECYEKVIEEIDDAHQRKTVFSH